MPDDLPGQQTLLDVVAPLSFPDVLNTCAEARDLLADVRRDLGQRDGEPVEEAAFHLFKALDSILLAERYLLRHARETGADLHGLVGDINREVPP
jgi:hypothetical protein